MGVDEEWIIAENDGTRMTQRRRRHADIFWGRR